MPEIQIIYSTVAYMIQNNARNTNDSTVARSNEWTNECVKSLGILTRGPEEYGRNSCICCVPPLLRYSSAGIGRSRCYDGCPSLGQI